MKVPPISVTKAPLIIKPRIALLSLIILLIRKFIPPSKRIIATAKPTSICNPGPIEVGSIQLRPSGPNKIPDNRRSTIPGRWRCFEPTWANIPRTIESPIVSAGLCINQIRIDLAFESNL